MAQTPHVETADISHPIVGALPNSRQERGIRVEWSDGSGLKMSWRIDVRRYYGKGILGVSGAELPQGRYVWVKELHAVYGAYVRSCLRTGNSFAVDLEFRHAGWFTTKAFAATDKYWDKAIGSITSNLEAWKAMAPPRPAA